MDIATSAMISSVHCTSDKKTLSIKENEGKLDYALCISGI